MKPRPSELAAFPFPAQPENEGYCIFAIELEKDPLIAFHGTSESNLGSIIPQGFKIEGELPSCSFAKGSPLALRYACERRSEVSPNGCVVVVRFQSLDGVKEETSIIHVYRPERMPEVIGYCIVPASYNHV